MDLRLSLTVAIVALSVACSDATPSSTSGSAEGGAAAPAAAAEQTACDLLTPASIQSVIGEAVESGEQIGYECTFRRPASKDGLRVAAVRVRLEVSSGSPGEVLERYKATMRAGLEGSYDPEPVTGMSDAAWDGDQMMATKSVASGRSAFVLIQLIEVDKSRQREFSRSVLQEVLGKIRN